MMFSNNEVKVSRSGGDVPLCVCTLARAASLAPYPFHRQLGRSHSLVHGGCSAFVHESEETEISDKRHWVNTCYSNELSTLSSETPSGGVRLA
jgi:hypothetical protein